ncbi:hypothetical protein DCAR_0727966 [Daucus carota subsp. sativus]|uniref:Uncharacterized protein n=1 Tax=Daucus carota subsp. sativus TaxID=79200 RepID=A0AAF1B704_DAUCS|nr:hypothetical protein DCAR_0727966 [Daucus carota subsp. sativus]
MDPFNNVTYHNVIKESIKKIPIPISNLSESLRIVLKTENFILIINYLRLDNLKQNFQVNKYFLMDEIGKIYNYDLCNNIILNLFDLNWYFLRHNYYELMSTIMSFRQFICEIENLHKRDTLFIFIYENSRSDDITQAF